MTSEQHAGVEWKADADIDGTAYRTMLGQSFEFEETVARLLTASGQDATEQGDGYKVSVEFVGTFEGHVFTLYDYKEDREIHVGGHPELNVRGLLDALKVLLDGVPPTPYKTTEHYDERVGHSWPVKKDANAS